MIRAFQSVITKANVRAVIPGLNSVFRFTSPSTFDYNEESEVPVCEITTNKEDAEIHLGYPANAPDEDVEIVLTPDAIGDNPVTWYYISWWNQVEEGCPIGVKRSKFSKEKSIVIGDDTTKIFVTTVSTPIWAHGFDFIFGTEPGNYNKFVYAELDNEYKFVLTNLPGNVNDVSFNDFILPIPLKYHPIIPYYNQVPAPTNISIIPDAIGDNPVTWYYRVLQLDTNFAAAQLSDELTYQQGEDTTQLIFNCNHIDYDVVDIFVIIKGTSSGHYTNFIAVSLSTPITDSDLPYNILEGVDLFLGEEAVNNLVIVINNQQIVSYNYDNELFELGGEDGNSLSFISPPDYDNPLDTDKNNVYNVFIVGSYGMENIEQVIEITLNKLED